MKNELKQSTRYSRCFFSLPCALVVILFTFVEPLEARTGLVYAQPLATTDIGGYLSTNALGANFISADNFNVSATASLGEATWIGSSLLRNGDVGKPADYINPALDYSGWEIRFYSSTGGAGSTTSQPSTLLYDQVVSFSAANQTAVSGTTNYTYDAVLPTSFVASAGTQYWFSVQALASNPNSMTNGLFLWGFGNAGNNDDDNHVD